MKNKAGSKDQPRLRLIQGGYHFETWFGSIRIVAAPEDTPPFEVDAVAAEEDTYLVMSADPVVRDPKEHSLRLMTRVIETQPETPGSVVVKGKFPLRLLAIIHDLNHEPTWREEWIANALEGIFQEAERRKLRSLALPLLGTKHGSLEKQRFVELLRDALERAPSSHLTHLWLVIPEGMNGRMLEKIEGEKRVTS